MKNDVLVLSLCVLAASVPALTRCSAAPHLTTAQRGAIYQAGIYAAQANCAAMLNDVEVPREPEAVAWCRLVLEGPNACEAP